MMSNHNFKRHFLFPLLIVILLWISIFLLAGPRSLFRCLLVADVEKRLAVLGTFGDLFGCINALFSGVAFAAIYYTLRVQQKQHDLQLRDLNMRREVAKIVADEINSQEIIEMSVPYGDLIEGKI